MIFKSVRSATMILSSLVLASALVWAGPAPPAGSCSNASLTGNYGFAINGTAGGNPIASVGQVTANGNGKIAGFVSTSVNGSVASQVPLRGVYHINSNCTGTQTITPQGGSPFHFELAIIAGGKQVQLIETDSGTTEAGNAFAQGVNTCSLAGTKGIYGLQGGGTEIGSGPLAYGGQINLRRDGTLNGSETGSINGTIFKGAKISGAYKIAKKCFGAAVVQVGNDSPIHLDLVVVNGEKGVLFIQTDANSLSSGFLQQ
jgi:hypothetical protein